jgi:hypothetical protein
VKKHLFISLFVISFGIIVSNCEKDTEIQSIISFNLNDEEVLFTRGEPDYGNSPFGFFNHLTPHVGNIIHSLEIFAGNEGTNREYTSETIELKIAVGKEKIDIAEYPCSINYQTPNFSYIGETIVRIDHYSGPSGYVQGTIKSVTFEDVNNNANSFKITDMSFTVKLFGDSYSIE